MKSEYEGSAAQFTIINVSGDDAGRQATGSILREEGYTVVDAASAAQALGLAQQEPPDLLIAEVELPDMDGIELCRLLKSDVHTEYVSVLHRSARHISDEDYVRALESGADGYLREPVGANVLLATVWALLRTARAKENLRKRRDELEARVAQRTAALVAEVRERRQAEEEAQRQASQARTLAQAAAELGRQLDLNAVLEAVYRYTSHALDVPVVTISLYNSEQEQFEPAYAVGLPPGAFESMQPVPYRLTTQAPDDGSQPVITPDVQQLVDFPNAAFYRELNIRTTVNVNLLRNGELVGRLNIGTIGEPREFSEGEIRLLRGLADLAALALNNARLFEEVKRGREQLVHLNRRLTQAEEEERRRLSQELHDSAGQLATALQMNLTMIRMGLPEGETRQQLEEAEALSNELYEEIRQVSHSLRPPHLQVLGLDGALRALCQQFGETVRMSVHYEGQQLPALGDEVTVSLYRIAQEALTNVARHAGECEVRVSLDYDGSVVRLVVEDNGVGFRASGAAAGKGIGLAGMRERMQSLQGDLRITSEPGEGTQVVAWCAVEDAA